MQSATASVRSHRAIFACALACLAACGGEDSPDDGTGGGGGSAGTGSCVPDTSTAAASAVALTPGDAMGATGQLCPRTDKDFFTIDVPAGASLIDVSAGYADAVTRVEVEVRLYEADGTTAIEHGEAADTMPDDGKSNVATTFRVPQAGKYVLVVRDGKDDEADNVGSYVVRVATAADPDTHEPNDDRAAAKAPDGMPAWIASRGDVDRYKLTSPGAGALVQLQLENPTTSKIPVRWALEDGQGKVIVSGEAAPSDKLFETLRPLPAAGDYFVTVSLRDDVAPVRRPDAAYRLMATVMNEGDPNDRTTRNDSGATATCAGGAGDRCGMAFAGSAVTLPMQTGQVGSAGDRDFFRVDVTSGVPAVLEATAKIVGASKVDLALDILVPHAPSTCATDAECTAINVACKSDSDCELSHKCLDATAHRFCKTGPCRLCAAAGACVPIDAASGPKACAVTQYTKRDVDGGGKPDGSGANVVRTAQPVFAAGPVYVVVHDFQDDVYDRDKSYTLDLRVLPEPDAGDRGATPEARNNFYDPYPNQDSELAPNAKRAVDITAAIVAGTPVTGFLSYESDSDWFKFKHPCPGMNCGLQWEWTQPGPSPIRAAFLMRDDGLDLHESWVYAGATATDKLAAPVTDVFGDGDCRECSFGDARHKGDTFYYYLQVRDVGADSWDLSGGGQYSFRMKAVTPGCPASCSEFGGTTCACWCKAMNMCPAGPEL